MDERIKNLTHTLMELIGHGQLVLEVDGERYFVGSVDVADGAYGSTADGTPITSQFVLTADVA